MPSNKNSTIEDIINKVQEKNLNANIDIIKKAYEYANSKHENQARLSGEPYIYHPLNVAYILAELELDEATICAALLHDVVEDTSVTHEDIVKDFNEEIAEMVEGVTKLR